MYSKGSPLSKICVPDYVTGRYEASNLQIVQSNLPKSMRSFPQIGRSTRALRSGKHSQGSMTTLNPINDVLNSGSQNIYISSKKSRAMTTSKQKRQAQEEGMRNVFTVKARTRNVKL